MSVGSASCAGTPVVSYRTVATPTQKIANIVTTPQGTTLQPLALPANFSPANPNLGQNLNITV